MPCNITNRIKSVLAISGKKNKELAEYMGISPQALRNKYNRSSFSADDLIKISDFTGYELAYINGDNKITLGTDCIREDKQEE